MLIPENSLFTPSAMLSGRPSWNCFFLKDGSEPVDNAAAKSEVLTAHIQEQLMSHMGHSRPGQASRNSGQVRYDPKAEVISEDVTPRRAVTP
jgi:hypothetical protein